jgi:hypothetical protein
MDELEPLDRGNVLSTAVVLAAIEVAIGVVSWLVWHRITR